MTVDNVKQDLRRLLLAAAGAVGMAADEAQKLVDRMVARGEVAEKDAKAVLAKIRASQPVKTAKEKVSGAAKKAGDAASKGLDSVLGALNLPTRSHVSKLERKIDVLSAKLRRLSKEKE